MTSPWLEGNWWQSPFRLKSKALPTMPLLLPGKGGETALVRQIPMMADHQAVSQGWQKKPKMQKVWAAAEAWGKCLIVLWGVWWTLTKWRGKGIPRLVSPTGAPLARNFSSWAHLLIEKTEKHRLENHWGANCKITPVSIINILPLVLPKVPLKRGENRL